jgi:hypothetical protein
MAQVFAGFVAGFALALLSTPLAALTLLRLRHESPALGRLLPAGVSAVPLAVVIHGALFMFCTAIGILLGLVLLAMRDAAGSTRALNPAFTLLVASSTLMLLVPFAAVLRRLRGTIVAAGLLVVLVFGVLMPPLAALSKFDGEKDQRRAPEITWFA